MRFIRTFALAFTMAFAAVSGLFFTSAAFAGNETNVSSGLTIKGKALAVHGYDVVAYFTVGRPTVGNSKFSVVHNDATYRFASAAHRDAFKADPNKYLPQYGGFCAYGVAVGRQVRRRSAVVAHRRRQALSEPQPGHSERVAERHSRLHQEGQSQLAARLPRRRRLS